MSRPKARFKGPKLLEMREVSPCLADKLQELWPHGGAISPIWGHPSDIFVEQLLSEARWASAELLRMKQDSDIEDIRAEFDRVVLSLRRAESVLRKHQQARADGRKKLAAATLMLRSLSPYVDRLLGPQADPYGTADELEKILSGGDIDAAMNAVAELVARFSLETRNKISAPALQAVETVDPTSRQPEKLSKKNLARISSRRRVIAGELATRVAQTLQTQRIGVTSTAATHLPMLDITDPRYFGASDPVRYESIAVKVLRAIGDNIGLSFSPETWRRALLDSGCCDGSKKGG